MSSRIFIAFAVAGLLACSRQPHAQSTPAQSPPGATQQPPAAPPSRQDSNQFPGNEFPEDTSKIPVMPSHGTPAIPADSGEGSAADAHVPLPSDTADPMRSPDDPAPDTAQHRDEPSSSSSSSSGDMDKILGDVDKLDQKDGTHRKRAVKEPEHQETSAEDIEVGKYELDRKNWKAALSRFESAMVLAPDEPDVYWGLAESQRHLGNLAAARGYYQKVAEYDPDSHHGKEAIKALKEPDIANAKAAPPATPAQ